LRPLVRLRAHHDDAESGVRLRCTSQGQLDDKTKSFTVPSIFGQLTAHSVPWKTTATPLTLTRLGLPGHQERPENPLRALQRLPDGRGRRHPARLRVPGTQLELNRQQPAPQLQRGTGRTADPGHLPRLTPGTSLGLDAADPHLRRTRRLLRPRVPTLGRHRAGHSAGEFGFDFTRFVARMLVCPAGRLTRRVPGDRAASNERLMSTGAPWARTG